MASKSATSSGALILREIGGQLKLALAQRQRTTKTWVLPKGHVEPGETLQKAALREIHEEAGLSNVQLLTYLGNLVRGEINKEAAPVQKTAHYYSSYALPATTPNLPTEQ